MNNGFLTTKRLLPNARRVPAAVAILLLLAPGAALFTAGSAAADALSLADARLPTPRYIAAGAAHGGMAYLVGGYQVDPVAAYVDDVIEYNPLSDTTRLLAVEADNSPGAASAVDTGAGVLVFGGWNGQRYLDQILFIQPELGISEVIGNLTRPLQGTSAVWTGKEAYIFGGAGYGSGPGAYSGDILRFVPGMPMAEKVGQLSNSKQYTSAVWAEGKAYVFGGIGWDGDLNDYILEWDPATGMSTVVGALPSARAGTTAALWGGQAYIFGGADKTGFRDQILRFDPSGPDLEEMNLWMPEGVAYASAVPTPLGIAVLGGWKPSGAYSDGIVLYTPDLLAEGAWDHAVNLPDTPAVGSADVRLTEVRTPASCGLDACVEGIVIGPGEDPATPSIPGISVPLPSGQSLPATCTLRACQEATVVVFGQHWPLPAVPPLSADVPDIPFDHVCVGPNGVLCIDGVLEGQRVGPTPGLTPAPLNTPPLVVPGFCGSAMRVVCQGPTPLPGGPQQVTDAIGPFAIPLPTPVQERAPCELAPQACFGPIYLFGPVHESTPGVPANSLPALWVRVETEGFYFPLEPNLLQSQGMSPIKVDANGLTFTLCSTPAACPVPLGPEAGAHGKATVIVGIGDEELLRVPLPVDAGA